MKTSDHLGPMTQDDIANLIAKHGGHFPLTTLLRLELYEAETRVAEYKREWESADVRDRAANARAEQAEQARKLAMDLVHEVDDKCAALRAERERSELALARKDAALRHLTIVARAYAGDTGLSDQHSLWDCLNEADAALAPAAPSASEGGTPKGGSNA